jgi:hypothetical protein
VCSPGAPGSRGTCTQDATRILREIKLLRQLKHPDIVEIKHIMLPPQPREFRDIYVVFELMETVRVQSGDTACGADARTLASQRGTLLRICTR